MRRPAKPIPKKHVPKKPIAKKPVPKVQPKSAPKVVPKAKPVSITRAEKNAKLLVDQKHAQQNAKQERQNEKKRLDELKQIKREEKHQANTTKAEARIELNSVNVIKQTMKHRFSSAKLMAHSISSRFEAALKAYISDNKDDQTEIGWLDNLQGHIKSIDLDFLPKKRKYNVTAAVETDESSNDESVIDLVEEVEETPKNRRLDKSARALDKAIVERHSRALPTRKFGVNSDVAAFFGGTDAVAMGFSIGQTNYSISAGQSAVVKEQVKDRLGISMGSNFTYSTSNNAEDAAVSSEYIRKRFFNKLNLVRFIADPKLMLSSDAIQALKSMNGASNGKIEWTVPLELWGEANKNGKVGRPDDGIAGGLYFGVYRFVPNTSYSTPTTFIAFGFWGCVGMKLEELKVATYNAFELNDQNIGDLASSCLGNLTISGDPMLEHRELSLRAPQNSSNTPPQLVKNSLGYFIVAQNVDRRAEFPDFDVTGTLPKWLNEPDLPNGHSLMKKFAGRIVFVDFNQKMIHYYTKEDGKLRVRTFKDASDLNNYDFVDLHSRAFELDHNTVKQVIASIESLQSRDDYEPIPGVKLSALKVDWDRALLADQGMSEMRSQYSITPVTFAPTIEMLRASYNGDRTLFNLVESYFQYFSRDQAVDLAKGYTFIGEDDDDDLKQLAQRMAIPQIGVMLHAAKMSEHEFPKLETAKSAVEKALDALENPNLDLKFPGLGKYLNEHGIAEFFKLKPHQVRALGMSDPLDKGVLDIDMGGGKTLVSILLIIRRIEMLKTQGVTPRALVVMPDALITNFYREIKKFTARDPNNKTATARLNVVTLRNANIKMRYYTPRDEVLEKMKGAPDNTIFLSSYSYLGGAKSVVRIYTGETRTKRNGEITHKAEFMFPQVEDLLNVVGINIVFLDESHKIKNNFENGSYAHKACMALSRVKNKFIMTGTFVSRTPQDMFNQVKFIDPTMLGSIADFKRRYTLNNGKDWNHDKLKDLRSYVQRRGIITMRREEWLHQLPPKVEKFHFVDFKEQTPVIYKMYETLWDATAEQYPAEFTEALGGKIDNDGDSDDEGVLSDLEASETLEDEEKEIARLQGETNDLVNRMSKGTVGARLMALRALVAAPERFPIFTEAFKTVKERMSFNVEELLKGPKDEKVRELVTAHFESLGGHYIPVSEQVAKTEDKIGKIIIMSDRALIASHMTRILQEAGFSEQDVVYYDASHKEHLEAFCDPEARFPSIMCAVENSIKEGVNMQSASRVIRLTVPWTTGDYDQSIARAFRTGQTKPVYVDNVLASRSFEPAMVARLVTRENVNKKVTSDFDSNEYIGELTINPTTAGPTGDISSEFDLRNYSYDAGGKKVDLLELHGRIYKYEVKMSNVWRASYLLKLVDTREQADLDPSKFVWKNLDRRDEIKYEGNDYVYDRVPTYITCDENVELENKIAFVNAERKMGYMYVQDERRFDRMRAVKLSFYQLDNTNERHEDRDIAGSNKLYEPWATAGIHEDEMAVPMKNEVSEAEIENSIEEQLRDIGQTDSETTLKQKIIRNLRAAAEQGFDEKLSDFLARNPLTIDNKLVIAVYDAITLGTFHKIFKTSKALQAVYSTLTKVKYNENDDPARLEQLFTHTAKKFAAQQDASEQGRTGRPVRVTIPAEPGRNERTLGGPARKDAAEIEDLTKLQVAIGDQNERITLVVPATLKNPSWKKMKTIPGYRLMKNAMFFPITSEGQVKSAFKRVERAGGDVTNVAEFDTPEFKKVLRILAQPEKPDQTQSVSIYNTITAAKLVAIDLMWITMERKLLIVGIDLTPKQVMVLESAGFRRMQPYAWKEVTPKTIAREVKRLSQHCALRNPVTLGSRIMKILKVRLTDQVLGI